eukprot:502557-Prorocentrum_minimum.AAC.1
MFPKEQADVYHETVMAVKDFSLKCYYYTRPAKKPKNRCQSTSQRSQFTSQIHILSEPIRISNLYLNGANSHRKARIPKREDAMRRTGAGAARERYTRVYKSSIQE